MKTNKFFSALEKPNMWAIVIGLSCIICMIILGYSLKPRHDQDRTVTVTGQGCRQLRSNWAVWTGDISTDINMDTKVLYKRLEEERNAVSKYLKQMGIPDSTFEFSAIEVAKRSEDKYNNDGDVIGSHFLGYVMTQSVKVQTSEIDKIKVVSRDITSLLNEGINIESSDPNYYILNLGDLKLSLIDDATDNAKQRANKLIHGYAKIKTIDNVDIGVFQIKGLYDDGNDDSDYSWGGSFDTSSEWKEVSVTVHATYIVK